MIIKILWAKHPVQLEPQTLDHEDFPSVVKRPEPRSPTGTDIPDEVEGWIHGIVCFGRTHKADHVAVEPNPAGHPGGSVKITQWDDDSEDRTPDEFHAKSFIYEPIKLKDGKWISQQFTEMWLTDTMKKSMEDAGDLPMFTQNHPVKVHAWADFVKPDELVTLHGIWETPDDVTMMEEVDAIPYMEFV